MEKLLPIFLRFVTFLAIVLIRWFRQRIYPLACHRPLRPRQLSLRAAHRLGGGFIRFALPVCLLIAQWALLTEKAQAQTYITKEYLYVNEPNAGTVLKFEIGTNIALTEVTGANGGPHWYPGTGASQLPSPHGLATDLNGKLYISETGFKGNIRRLSCDGVIEPVSANTINTLEDFSQNIFSIGNTIYHNSTGGTSAYNSCTGQKIGKLCLAGASGTNQWGLSYNPVTEMVYVSDRNNNNVWVFSRGQLEAGIAGNPGACIAPKTTVPTVLGTDPDDVFGIVGDNDGNFYVVRGSSGTIFKFNSSGQVIASVNIKANNTVPIGMVWSATTNRLYIANLIGDVGKDCISTVDAATMTYLGTAIPNPTNATSGAKAIQLLRESCPVNLPATFTRNVCGAVGKKFYLNQEAFKGADGIVCGSSWTPTTMEGMTFDACDNSVTITGEGCGTFTLNIGAVSSTGCPAQTSTFTICNTFPPDITVTTQADCTPNGKYTLTGTVTVTGPGTPTTGILTVRVPGGGSQVFNPPFTGTINYSIPNIVSTGDTRSVYAEFSSGNCQKEQVYKEPATCPVVCSLTLKPTVSGCYQNAGSSKATVSVEVSWENATISPTANDSSDVIRVTFGGQTKIINPGAYTTTGGSGTIVSPQVVAFELPADASTQTAQAFFGASYAASTCKAEKTGIVLPAACPPTVCDAGQTGGTVWNDFNADGIKQSGETTGLAGVTVKAYDCNGTLVGTAITDAFGRYAFTGLTSASYPIRVEFSNLPAFAGQGTLNGTDGRTTTQFVNAADCNVDLGILDPTDFCQTNPKLVIPCYVSGDPLVAGTSGSSDAVVSFDYTASGYNAALMAHAPAQQVGALWGMAYNKFTKKIFSSATVKRHAGLGPLGLGGIYVSDFTNTPANGSTFNYSNFIDVSTIGINLGSIADNTTRGLLGDKTQPSADSQGYLAVGKAGIGGIDLSADGNLLYLTNLFDNKLYEINITAYNTSATLPTAADVKSYDMSTGINCTGGNLHAWGVKVHKGKVYTGMVCDASISQNKSDLRAFVQELNGTTVSTIFDFPLTYPKGFPVDGGGGLYTDITGWYPWTDDWSKKLPGPATVTLHPEPIFSSIEFDIDGSMILAFADRTGLQSGYYNYSPSGASDPIIYANISGGDVLRAYSNGTSYVLENNAKAGPNVGYGANNNQGPGFGEFYNDDFLYNGGLAHTENALGGLALRPGSGEVIGSAMDPLDGTIFNAGGVRHLNNTTGLVSSALVVYTSNDTPGTFGKGTGLGDMVVACDLPTYLEIGNRVWNDTDKDGIQDPCEKVLTGVNVSLYKGATLIATTTTDVNGEYYFSTKSKIGTGTWSGTGADTTLLPTTGYKLVFGAGQTTGGALTVAGLGQFILTLKDATTNNGNDQNDSDAEVLSGAFCINLTTGALASVNHTFDAGFVCINPAIKAAFSQTKATCTGTTENNNGKVTLTAAATPYDKFRVKLSTAAWGADSSYATATAIGSTFPVDLVTTAPNAGATYVVRFYTGECCYKDTTVTVVPTPCVVGSIGDYVWKDANRNGKQDGSETGVNGVKVILWSATTTGTPVAKLDSTATAGGGKYLFSNLPKGDYVVQFVKSTIPPECSGFTAKDTTTAGTTDTNDSDADKTTGITAKITLDPKVLSGTSTPADSLATNNFTVDAGLVAPQGSLGDFVWKDTNNNGIQDETTPNAGGVAGVQVELYKNGTLFAKDTTDATGHYLFSNLDAGTYKIKILTASLPTGCEISAIKDAPSDDAKDSDVDKTTGFSGDYVINPLDATKKDILTVDAGLAVPCVKSNVTLIGAPACSADVQSYSITFSVTGKNGTIKVNKGILTGDNPYTVTGIPSGATITITDSLSAICKSDTIITGPNCNCNPPTPVLITPSLTACIGDTFPTIKATVLGSATVEWFATATSTTVLFTGLNYKPAGNVTAAGATFYAQARSTDPTCPAAISTSRVLATINAQNCTVEVDLALKKSINKKIAQIGDVLTYTLKVWNESSTNATGVEVVDSIATTVQFQTGSFTASRGSAAITGNVIKWAIGNIAANGDTVTLTYRIKATQEGVHFNTAEICKTNEKDVDSTPCNHDEDEDDIDRQCFTVPVKLCPGEKAEVNVPSNLTNVQWFKNGGTASVATGNSVLLTEVGTYTFTATNQTCPASGCCPIIIEPGVNCCPEDLCIPFTIKQTKKGKK